MEYFVISAKFVPLKYYTLSSQLRRLTSFSVGCLGRRILSPGQIAVMRKWSTSQSSWIVTLSTVLLYTGVSGGGGGTKGARAPCGSEAKTVKLACFGPTFISFHHSAPRSTPLAWNPAYASVIHVWGRTGLQHSPTCEGQVTLIFLSEKVLNVLS